MPLADPREFLQNYSNLATVLNSLLDRFTKMESNIDA